MLHVEQLVVKISASFLEVANFYLVLGGVGGWGGAYSRGEVTESQGFLEATPY